MNGVAGGRKEAYLELIEQISGSEQILLGGTLRHAIHEALEEAAVATDSLWSDHPVQFDRVGTGLSSGVREDVEVFHPSCDQSSCSQGWPVLSRRAPFFYGTLWSSGPSRYIYEVRVNQDFWLFFPHFWVSGQGSGHRLFMW